MQHWNRATLWDTTEKQLTIYDKNDVDGIFLSAKENWKSIHYTHSNLNKFLKTLRPKYSLKIWNS